MSRLSILALAAVVALGLSGEIQAAGFQTYFEQSAAAMGQAAAVVARAPDPSAVFYNPAASCLLPGTQVHATFDGIMLESVYLAPPGEFAGQEPSRTSMSDDVVPVGAFHLTRRTGDRVTLGLGVNTPYGSRTEWSQTWSGRYYAGLTALKSVFVAPTVGYSLSANLSLGMGIALVWGQASVEKAINAPVAFASAVPDLAPSYMSGAFSPDNDVHTRLEADGWGFGGRLGLHWRLTDRWAVGAAYQGQVSLDLAGRATYSAPLYEDSDFGRAPQAGETANQLIPQLFPGTGIEIHLDLPATLSGGIAFAATEALDLEVDLMWTEWSSYDTLTVVYESLGGETDARSSTPKYWEDTLTLRVGLAYDLSERFVGRLGYAFDESPIPDSTRDPSLPGSDRHDLTLGIGYRSPWWAVDISYIYAMMDACESELSTAKGGDLTGSYEVSAHILALATTFYF